MEWDGLIFQRVYYPLGALCFGGCFTAGYEFFTTSRFIGYLGLILFKVIDMEVFAGVVSCLLQGLFIDVIVNVM